MFNYILRLIRFDENAKNMILSQEQIAKMELWETWDMAGKRIFRGLESLQ
jgi:hypothetical protein